MAGKNLRSANSRCHVRALVKKLNCKCVAEWVQVWIKFKEDLSVFHVYLTRDNLSAAPMGRAGRNATEGWGANSVETIRRQALPRTVMWPVCDQTVTVSSAASAALWTPSSLMWISCASRDVSVALVNVEEDVTHEVEGGCRVLPCSGAFPRATSIDWARVGAIAASSLIASRT